MRRGFTLVEILIVVAISGLLSAIALVYSGVARNQVALSVETAKVAQTILKAKSLAIATYKGSGTAVDCGYGVVFSPSTNRYSIFAYTPGNYPPEHNVAPPCPNDTVGSTSPIYANEMASTSPDTWNIPIANGVKMNGAPSDALTVVMFYPPAPDTYISRDPASGAGQTFLNSGTITSKVYLVTVDGSASDTITVNSAGQVTF